MGIKNLLKQGTAGLMKYLFVLWRKLTHQAVKTVFVKKYQYFSSAAAFTSSCDSLNANIHNAFVVIKKGISLFFGWMGWSRFVR
jgi:hypothetical protein